MRGTIMKYFEESLEILLENIGNKADHIYKLVSRDLLNPKSKISRLVETGAVENNPQSVAEFFNQADPSPNAEYTQWIAKIFSSSNIVLPDDAEQVKQTLVKFGKAKKSNSFTGKKDINQYKSYQELYVAVKDIGLEEGATTYRAWDKYVKDNFTKYVKKVYECPLKLSKIDELGNEQYQAAYRMLVVFPTDDKFKSVYTSRQSGSDELYGTWVPVSAVTPEDLQAAQAKARNYQDIIEDISMAGYCASLLAKKGSSWCVSNPKTADNYLKNGPLYFIYKNSQTIDGQIIHTDRFSTPFFLANANWSEIKDPGADGTQKDLSNPSVQTCIFFLRLLNNDEARNSLTSGATAKIISILKRQVGRLSKMQVPDEYRQKINIVINEIEKL